MKDNKDSRSKPKKPPMFNPAEYRHFWRLYENYLEANKNVDGVPISYATRDDTGPDRDENVLKWQVRLSGPRFEEDSKWVLTELNSFLKETEGYQWIRRGIQLNDGRRASLDFQAHYEGEMFRNTKLTQATKRLDSLFYKKETALPFSKFVDVFKDCVDDRDAYGCAQYDESTKAQELLDKMSQCTQQNVVSAMETVRSACS